MVGKSGRISWLCLVFVAELAAGGGDVSAARGADVYVSACVFEDGLEAVDGVVFGALVGEGGDLVVADQVDVGPEFSGHGGELMRVFGLVVDVAQEDVFQCDFAAGGGEVFAPGVDELLDGDELCPRNDLFAQLVIGRVQ